MAAAQLPPMMLTDFFYFFNKDELLEGSLAAADGRVLTDIADMLGVETVGDVYKLKPVILVWPKTCDFWVPALHPRATDAPIRTLAVLRKCWSFLRDSPSANVIQWDDFKFWCESKWRFEEIPVPAADDEEPVIEEHPPAFVVEDPSPVFAVEDPPPAFAVEDSQRAFATDARRKPIMLMRDLLDLVTHFEPKPELTEAEAFEAAVMMDKAVGTHMFDSEPGGPPVVVPTRRTLLFSYYGIFDSGLQVNTLETLDDLNKLWAFCSSLGDPELPSWEAFKLVCTNRWHFPDA